MCSPDCPGTYSIDQAVLELKNQLASAFQVLGLKVGTTATQLPDKFVMSSILLAGLYSTG